MHRGEEMLGRALRWGLAQYNKLDLPGGGRDPPFAEAPSQVFQTSIQNASSFSILADLLE